MTNSLVDGLNRVRLDATDENASFYVVDGTGNEVAIINLFYHPDAHYTTVDVIPHESLKSTTRVDLWKEGRRERAETRPGLVAVMIGLEKGKHID